MSSVTAPELSALLPTITNVHSIIVLLYKEIMALAMYYIYSLTFSRFSDFLIFLMDFQEVSAGEGLKFIRIKFLRRDKNPCLNF